MTTFRTVTDTNLRPRNGQEVTILRAVDPASYDSDEVGPMFTVRFPDGAETDAFGDELVSDPSRKDPEPMTELPSLEESADYPENDLPQPLVHVPSSEVNSDRDDGAACDENLTDAVTGGPDDVTCPECLSAFPGIFPGAVEAPEAPGGWRLNARQEALRSRYP